MHKCRYAGLVLGGFTIVMANPATFSISDIKQYMGSAVSLGAEIAIYMSPRYRALINLSDKHPHNGRQCS